VCSGFPVPKFQSPIRIFLRFFAVLLGLGLLSYLVFRTGPESVWKQAQEIGWGLILIIILGGFSQLIRTCAWRQALTCDIRRLTWSRSLGAQLASDAMGQLGFAGKLLGEGIKVSLLSPAVPLASGISSCAIDGGMHLLTASVVAVLGICMALLHFPLSGHWRVYAVLLAALLIALVVLAAVAVASRWRLMGNAARVIGRLPQLHNWIIGKEPIIDSAEHNLLAFRSEAPTAFWASLIFSFLWHALAILEVYLILGFLRARVALVGALALEGLTKVINLMGALNPGNLGTYEGGNMLIANMFGVPATAGLTLALCRRARSIFWAGVGAIWLIVMKRSKDEGFK
jgi:Lysylphosphatidylglycerol synthase TM region